MSISVLGIYVADLVFFGKKIPVEGETILGNNFVIGPGGKGSNQAVAAAKAGVKTYFISKIGDDQFGEMATKIYEEARLDYSNVIISKEHSTGAAAIMVNEKSGANAINVFPGAAGALTIADIDNAKDTIINSSIFLTQLEAPMDVVCYALKMAKENNVTTILNPAPAAKLDKEIFPLIDYFTPNDTEASFYIDGEINTVEDAKKYANQILDLGIKNVLITLGEKGVYFANKDSNHFEPSLDLQNKVVDTSGAGDAFNGAFATALCEGQSVNEAIKFANCYAGISTTRIGTANSMPSREEIDKIL